jgi:putative nucleotidyltransferase with HDIG domain
MQPLDIVERLRAAGHAAYYVGGCVRDLLLGREPKDYDIATSARPHEVLALYPDALPVGAHFGVVLVGGVEVATFRSDQAYGDGRRPDAVVYETSPAADAARRDFTINGLFLDPVSGEVLDCVGGRADLAAGIIRAIGDPALRFAEDHLRLLRAVRFAARFGFVLEDGTRQAMTACAASIRLVAAERVRDELTRILTEGGAQAGFFMLRDTKLLVQVLPEIAAMEGVEQPPQFHPEGDVFTHTLLMLAGLREPTMTLAWGVLLHDVGKPPTFRRADRIRFDGHASVGARMARDILNRLRCSAAEVDQVVSLVTHHLDWMHVREMRASTLRRFLRLPHFDEHLELHRLDCESSHRRLENYEFVRAQLRTLTEADLRPAPLITGHDLIAAGFVPGPAFSNILRELETAQLEGLVRTRDDAIALAREFAEKLSDVR